MLLRSRAVTPASSTASESVNLDDTLRLEADAELTGTFFGEIIVSPGVTLVLHGVARSDVIVEKGARAIIRGMIVGCLINLGGDAEIFGAVEVIADAPGVSTRIHPGAIISGRPTAPPKIFASGS